MAIPPIATIRSSPKEIKATETYHMQLDLISYIRSETVEKSGKIEIVVPYDGNVHVSRQSTKDLTAQRRYNRLLPRSRALIGYLNFQNHVNTDLDAQYFLSQQNDILPFDIGLKERGLRYLEALNEDQFEQYSQLNYEPDALFESPLLLNFFITDEILKDRFTKELMPKFKKHILLGFDIVLRLLPHQMELLESEDVELFDFRMDWVTIPTTERITATRKYKVDGGRVVGEDTAVFYDAESQQIVCPKLKLAKDELKKQYYTKLIIQVPEPMDIYQEKIFTGTAQIKFPFLLSGLRLNYFNTTGERSQQSNIIKAESKLLAKFQLDIAKSFRNKRYVPSQLLQFPQVILDDMRIYELKTILRDEGFTGVRSYPRKLESLTDPRMEIYAERDEGAGILRLRLRLEGKTTATERRRTIPGDERFKTIFHSGGFMCLIQGELIQDSQTVVNLINKIHTIIKERFQQVTILD